MSMRLSVLLFSSGVLLLAGVTAQAPSLAYTLFSETSSMFFGRWLRVLGDLDGDGLDDFATTQAPGEQSPHYIRVFSGGTGAELWTVDEPVMGADALWPAGDVNADGVPDLLYGRRIAFVTSADSSARVYSGVDGSVLMDIDLPGPVRVSPAGDVNADGFDDIAVGLPNAAPGGLVVAVVLVSFPDATARPCGRSMGPCPRHSWAGLWLGSETPMEMGSMTCSSVMRILRTTFARTPVWTVRSFGPQQRGLPSPWIRGLRAT